ANSVRRPSCSHLLDLSFDGRSERDRICLASHDQGQIEERIDRIGQIKLRPSLIAEAARFGVLGDADNVEPLLPFGTWPPEELFADGVFIGPRAPGQIGVDDYKWEFLLYLQRREIAPGDQADAHRAEIIRQHGVRYGRQRSGRRFVQRVGRDHPVRGERQRRNAADRLNTGHCTEFFYSLSVEMLAVRDYRKTTRLYID